MQIPIDRQKVRVSMIELGKIQKLMVQRVKSFGVYLGEENEPSNSYII